MSHTISKENGICLWQPSEKEFESAAILISPEIDEIILEQEGAVISVDVNHLEELIKCMRKVKQFTKD